MPKISSYGGMTPILTDLLYGVDDPGGTPISDSITITALRDLLEANLVSPVTSGNFAFSTDLFLERDDADILALRNSTTAQEFRIYNSWTDASNNEYVRFTWKSAANRFDIRSEKTGSGTMRDLLLVRGSTFINLKSGSMELLVGNASKIKMDATVTTLTGNSILLKPASNRIGLNLTGFSLTAANAHSFFDFAGTWNTTGTPTAIKLNITDTASDNASLLMDLQVGSSSVMAVEKGGAITSVANAGTPGTGTTASEYGDGYNHITVLTMAGVLPAIASGDDAVGLLIYTFPAGVHRVKSIHMDVGIDGNETNIDADQPDVGLGSLIAASSIATLDLGTDLQDYVDGLAAANCTGTVTDASEDTQPAGLKLNEAGGTKTLHFNAADGWAGTDTAAVLSGTVTIEWTFLGA